LNAQLAGVVASPITGLVRGLGSLLSGLAIALGQVHGKRAAEEPAEEQPAAEEGAEAPAAEAEGDENAEQPEESDQEKEAE
jgi:large subunit ribosomal protein L10